MNFELGKLPPQAIDLEEAILGALLIDEYSLINIIDIIKPESFYKESHNKIFTVITELSKSNKSIDLLTVTESLKQKNELETVGGPYYISQLTMKIGTSNHIEDHAKIIAQKYLQRELIRITSDINRKAYDDFEDVYDLINDLNRQNNELLNTNSHGINHISICVDNVYKIINKNFTGELNGIVSGFIEYDRFTKGEQPGDLVVIAGETSQGKTALALCKAFNQAILGKKVAIFSYEMTSNQITARLMALACEVSAKSILMDKLTDAEMDQINRNINELISKNIYIVDIVRRSYDWLESKIKTIVQKYEIESIIIDYLQLISIDGLKRNDEVARIANNLKSLATNKNINIPITLLSQLKRSDSHHKPELWRLKETGDIENAADIVIGIWRPHYYNINDIKIRVDGFDKVIDTTGKGLLHILKGRNIGTKDIMLDWNGELTKYSDYTNEKEIFNEF